MSTLDDKPKKIKKKRKRGKGNKYFGGFEQESVENYVNSLIGTPRRQLEDHQLDDKEFVGFFTVDSRLDGEYKGFISGSIVGYVGDEYVSGSIMTTASGLLSVSTFGPGPGPTKTHLSGVFTGHANGAFEPYNCGRIYEDGIKLAFETLVNSLIHTYKINFFGEDVYAMADDCVSFLYESLHKYDPSTGKKAFSYFNVCAKNWLIGKSTKLAKHQRRHVDINEPLNQSEISEWRKPKYMQNAEMRAEEEEFLPLLIENIDSWIEDESIHEDERALLVAVKELFNRSGDIEVINKRSVYMFLRELCSFNRNELGRRLKSIRGKYAELKSDYNNGNI